MKDSWPFFFPFISFVALGASPRTYALDKGLTTGLGHQHRVTRDRKLRGQTFHLSIRSPQMPVFLSDSLWGPVAYKTGHMR